MTLIGSRARLGLGKGLQHLDRQVRWRAYLAQQIHSGSREKVGCDPGFFYSWRDVNGGALWPTTGVGDTIRVWIVDMDGTRLFIEAETTQQAVGGLAEEVQQIVESIRFE